MEQRILSPEDDTVIVPLSESHLPQVVELHVHHVKSMLADLGRPFCRAFYLHAVHSPNCLGFVDFERGHVRGFILGALDNSTLFSAWSLRLKLLRILAVRPALWSRFLFHLTAHFSPAPEILYEAVDPAWRRQGIATGLTQALAEAYRERGITRYEIRIDRDNLPNLARHCKLGAHIVREFIEDGVPRYLLDSEPEMQ